MILRCGRTDEQKRQRRLAEDRWWRMTKEWHRVFAWRPRAIGDGRCAFLVFVQRRRLVDRGPFDRRWEYKA